MDLHPNRDTKTKVEAPKRLKEAAIGTKINCRIPRIHPNHETAIGQIVEKRTVYRQLSGVR